LPRMEIIYSNMEVNVQFDENFFSEEKYIAMKNKKLVPIGKYSKYELINQKIK
jgi:hypothetical protein